MKNHARSVPILMYHHISPNPGLVTIAPALFHAHMKYLAEQGWHTPSSLEIEQFLAGTLDLPKKSVVLSFDDGYLDNFMYAHPTLVEFNLHALLFIVTDWIGNGSVRSSSAPCPNHRDCKALIAKGDADQVMLRWSEIERMHTAGSFEFHSHTHTHTRFDKLYADYTTRDAALHADLCASRETLLAKLGHASTHLAWPQGFYDDNYIEVATKLGFQHIYTTEKQPLTSEDNPLKIGRIVAKEKSVSWLARTLYIHTHPLLSRAYLAMQGNVK